MTALPILPRLITRLIQTDSLEGSEVSSIVKGKKRKNPNILGADVDLKRDAASIGRRNVATHIPKLLSR